MHDYMRQFLMRCVRAITLLRQRSHFPTAREQGKVLAENDRILFAGGLSTRRKIPQKDA
jgi:hypothetical protein